MRRLALLGVLGALAGCGGDDRPSRDEFARQANEICRELETRTQQLQKTDPNSPREYADLAEDVRSATQDTVDEIGELEVPGGAEGERAQAWKDALKREAEEEILPALDGFKEAAESGDPRRILETAQRLQRLQETATDESERLAREIGANECA